MNKQANIKVTRDHINRGQQGYGTNCPIALAITDHIQSDLLEEVLVHIEETAITFYDERIEVYGNSREVSEWIRSYDHATDGKQPEPVTLAINDKGLLVIKHDEE